MPDGVILIRAAEYNDFAIKYRLIQFNDADVLHDKGKVTATIAKAFAESEFEQYRVIQDSLYQSDFDRLISSVEKDS